MDDISKTDRFLLSIITTILTFIIEGFDFIVLGQIVLLTIKIDVLDKYVNNKLMLAR